MSLEATMILVDNSNWSRNGDFIPTRWEAQKEAASLISKIKFQSHPDNSVGLMSMARNQVELLVTPTNDDLKILSCLHSVKIGGNIHFNYAIQIAQLALKHRLNKVQRQRILIFIASPIVEEEAFLINLAKKLKKNTVAVDIINLIQNDSTHIQKLEKFIETVNNSDNSHFVNIHPGINLLADSLMGTAIIEGRGGENADINVDPNVDPDLAMVLRISLEEENARQKLFNENETNKNKDKKDLEKIDEEEVQKNEEVKEEDKKKPVETGKIEEEKVDEDELNEEELLERAKHLSLQDNTQVDKKEEKMDRIFQDKDFMKDLIGMIPDLDVKNPEIQKALEDLNEKKDDKKGEENLGEKKEEEKKK